MAEKKFVKLIKVTFLKNPGGEPIRRETEMMVTEEDAINLLKDKRFSRNIKIADEEIIESTKKKLQAVLESPEADEKLKAFAQKKLDMINKGGNWKKKESPAEIISAVDEYIKSTLDKSGQTPGGDEIVKIQKKETDHNSGDENINQ